MNKAARRTCLFGEFFFYTKSNKKFFEVSFLYFDSDKNLAAPKYVKDRDPKLFNRTTFWASICI